MSSSTPLRTLASAALLLLLVHPCLAANVARFWLENTISHESYGPILNQAGYRFQIGTEGYVVLQAKPGQVLFSTYPQPQSLGPFDLQPDRIIDLGEKAYAIVRLDSVPAPTIPSDVLPNAPNTTPTFAVPGTSPRPTGPIPAEPWTWSPSQSRLVTSAWYEPFHSTKYDWSLGSVEGSSASDLELSRLGATVEWGGFEGSLGYSITAKHADSIVPPTEQVLDDLRLEEGDGLFASAGYAHRIPLERRWHAVLGGLFEYRSESYGLNAIVFDGTDSTWVEVPADPNGTSTDPVWEEQIIQNTKQVTESVTLEDYVLLLHGGIAYEADAWGTRIDLLITAWDDTTTDASIQILEEPEYVLTGSRSHPVTVSVAAWCYVLEGVKAEAKASFGGDTALRLGVGYEW